MAESSPQATTSDPTPATDPSKGDGQESTASQPKPSSLTCPACNSLRIDSQDHCEDCGLVFASFGLETVMMTGPRLNAKLLHGRYQIGDLISARGEVSRSKGFDYASGAANPLPVVILRGPSIAEGPPERDAAADGSSKEVEVLPTFDDRLAREVTETVVLPFQPPWPSVAWERFLLGRIKHPSLPSVLDSFTFEGNDYLVEEVLPGQPLWDAWDAPTATAEQRFGWLQQIALAMQQLHQFGVVIESLRPEILAVSKEGSARFADLSDFLALPLPAPPLIRASFYTAPELVLTPEQADSRADLFGFGALLYVLFVGRELADVDFARPGVPKPFLPQFPDVHPLLGRLISKTFLADRDVRLPTDEAIQEDVTGFKELIRNLEVCRRSLDQVRLDVAAWTTTGMVRTYNEDAFTVLHTLGSRQDYLEDSALVLLADGMGGNAAGEVAAALALQSLQKNLLHQPMFAALTADPVAERAPFEAEACEQLILTALKEANREIHAAAQQGVGKRGMGCTAEVVYVTGRNLVVGHAGDSRTYLFNDGRLFQITHDQTLVGRLVELGKLTPDEAAKHPRRSELQQALGGRPDIDPLLYHSLVKPGDWIIVCSDGLSSHVTPDELKQVLQTEATSAETAARRLVNRANLKGAVDNVTAVVVRVS
jgi:serine/threonine protein phosphatase PrpC